MTEQRQGTMLAIITILGLVALLIAGLQAPKGLVSEAELQAAVQRPEFKVLEILEEDYYTTLVRVRSTGQCFLFTQKTVVGPVQCPTGGR